MTAADSRSPLRRLLHYCRNHRPALLLATLYSIANKLFDLAPPLLIGAAVDVVVSRQSSFVARLGYPDATSQLWLLSGFTLLVWGLESVFEYAYARKWRGLAQTIQHELRMDVYAHVQRLDVAYFEDQNVGGLLAVLNDDVNQLERFLDNGANQIIQLLTTLLVVGGMFAGVVPSVAWMTLLPMPVVFFGSIAFQRKLEPYYADVRRQVSLLGAELGNNLSGIAVIKSFAAENHEVRRIGRRSREYEAANRRAIQLSSAFVPLIRMVIVLGFAAMLVYGGKLALSGSLNVGLYSVVVFMTQRLLWPLTSLGSMLDQYQRAMASTTRALDLLDQKPKVTDAHAKAALTRTRGEIELERVSFHYGSTDRDGAESCVPVLSNLSVHIPAGQTVAFVGATGAGKTTLVKLLLRFYDVSSGSIRLDGRELAHVPLSDLRRSIGLVSQDVFLFHGTVRENIAYGNFDAPMSDVIAAAKAAEAHAFIERLPKKYETVVGERGQKLSGGQRQRISIARAVLHDPPVLVLDEATSSVDNETEAAIQRSLERIAVGRTTILIAHRLSTVRRTDRTFVLEEGRLSEQGTHEQLLANDGLYAALWRVQTGERVGAA